MPAVTIEPVRTKSQLNEFINLPWSIYPPECNWVPPLKKQVRELLDTSRHPYWQFSRQVLFLARRGSEAVGRIAGIIDGNHNEYHHETSGSWGFFECRNDPEAAAALLAEVESWVRAEGMNVLRGPFNPSTNYECGMLVDGYEYLPAVMMPWNHPYYPELVEAAGYAKEKDLISYKITPEDPPSERLRRLARRIRRQGKIWSRKGSKKNLEAEMALMAEIYRSAWADNWGFVPMTEAETKEMAKNLLPIMREEWTMFFYYDQEPVGVVMAIPDVNPLLKRLNGKIGLLGPIKYLLYRHEVRAVRGVLFGVKKQYHRMGFPILCYDELDRILRGHPDECAYMELGWNLEDNSAINKFEEEAGAHVIKRHRIYRKDLS
jgi:hypothetical protein